MIIFPSAIIVEESDIIIFEGSVEHASIESCSMSFTYQYYERYPISVNGDGSWSFVIIEADTSENIVELYADCGQWEIKSTSKNVSLVFMIDKVDSD